MSFDDDCADAQAAVEAAIAAGDDVDFPDKWGDFKDRLAQAQYGKCGYCEIFVVAGQHGDVEHFRPKGRISRLTHHGQERDHLGNVENRRMVEEASIGYWWAAYDWNNYLLSCMNCNQKWKKDLFPIDGNRAQTPANNDTALLMNPFERRNPANHLYFDDLGAIVPHANSKFGRATIETCGLDRVSLTTARTQQSRTAHQLVRELVQASDSGSDGDFEQAIRGVYEAGDAQYQFAGVIRAVIKHDCALDWAEIEVYVNAVLD